jgi:hypothetical protein
MQFYEKLDFLMNITKTSNSALGQKVKLDASYISRLRKGQRGALKDIACIKYMAEYFARNCKEDYQRKAIAEALKITTALDYSVGFSAHIAKWLVDEKKDDATTVANFLSGFSNSNARQGPPEMFQRLKVTAEYPQEDISVYYGVEGKRRAAIYFLSEVIAQSKPQTLLLFSDEATDWMTSDRDFASQWASLMVQLLSKGNRVKIIHTVSRDLDEMLNAIRQWMPLYMTGLIEPYFYPKKRDGIFKKTLFISPGISAVISSSIGNSIEHAANILIRNRDMIESYFEEFNQYLFLCKPLMRIFTAKDKDTYFKTIIEFEKEKSNSIIKTESLSILTMPDNIVSEIIARIGNKEVDCNDIRDQRKRLFENNLKVNSYTEIINLFDADYAKSGKIKVAFSEMLLGDTVYYTLEEYILHLEYILLLLEKYENFHVYFTKGETESQYIVYAREDLGAIVAKTSTPPVVLAINEANLATAFWDFLRSMIAEKSYQYPNNKESAKMLADYIQRIKQSQE